MMLLQRLYWIDESSDVFLQNIYSDLKKKVKVPVSQKYNNI